MNSRLLWVWCVLALCGVVERAPALAIAHSPPGDELTPEQEDRLFDTSSKRARSDESDDKEDIRQGRRRELADLEVEELEGAGFDFGNRKRRDAQQATAALVAAGLGPFVSGIGHWYVGERRTALTLAAVQATGVALASAGLFFREASAPAARAPARHMAYVGVSLAGLAYVLDVVGTVQGADVAGTRREDWVRDGLTVWSGLGYVTPRRFPVRLIGDLGVDLYGERVYGSISTRQDVQLTTSMYDASAGWVILQGSAESTQLIAQAHGQLFQFRSPLELGAFWRASAGGVLGGSVDLSRVASTLRGLVVGGKIGYMQQFWFYPGVQLDEAASEREPLEYAQTTGVIPYEAWAQLAVDRRLLVRLAYRRWDGQLVHDRARLLAVPEAQVRVNTKPGAPDVVGIVQYGSGFAIYGGLRYALGD
ncbi:MAG: hypothetical protein AAGI01_03860 [Myxococcota bacterium]